MDINADLGESWYEHRTGNDAVLMPFITSCNIACGMHGGDALAMRKAIDLAIKHGVRIGAHPSYPDRENFGRQSKDVDIHQLSALLDYQVAALSGMAAAAGAKINHLKPHGALYHDAAFFASDELARAIIETAVKFGRLAIYGPQGSHLERLAHSAGLTFVPEGFCDRVYEAYNRLVPRSEWHAIISEPELCAKQAANLANGRVELDDGAIAEVAVKTICVHGDHYGSAIRAEAVWRALGYGGD